MILGVCAARNAVCNITIEYGDQQSIESKGIEALESADGQQQAALRLRIEPFVQRHCRCNGSLTSKGQTGARTPDIAGSVGRGPQCQPKREVY